MKKIKNSSFTMSEVLITLVVIGIIAAITITALIGDYREKERISKIKKTYSSLSQGLAYLKADGGDIIFDHAFNDDIGTLKVWFNQYIKPRFITHKVCYNEKGCWTNDDIKYLSGSISTSPVVYKGKGLGAPTISFILSDGTYVCIDRWDKYSVKVNSSNSYIIALYFDINGDKGPNMFGKDIFMTVFTEDYGFVPAYKDATDKEKEKSCSSSGNGFYCLAKYLAE